MPPANCPEDRLTVRGALSHEELSDVWPEDNEVPLTCNAGYLACYRGWRGLGSESVRALAL